MPSFLERFVTGFPEETAEQKERRENNLKAGGALLSAGSRYFLHKMNLVPDPEIEKERLEKGAVKTVVIETSKCLKTITAAEQGIRTGKWEEALGQMKGNTSN